MLLIGVGLAAGWAGLTFLADRETASWWAGERAVVLPLARTVAARSAEGRVDVDTGIPLFDAEWTLVTCQMTAIGLAQVVRAHPEDRDALMPGIRACAARLLEPRTRRMGTERWGEDGWSASALASERGHAYLGWVALGLSAARSVDTDPPWAEEHDALIAGLDHKMGQPAPRLETYPGQVFPADQAAVIGAVGLHAQVTGQPARNLETFIESYRSAFVHDSGWIRHDGPPGGPFTEPRGATTAVSSWFLGFADPVLAGTITEAHKTGDRRLAGFAGVREYLPDTRGSIGDMDSGPVVLGLGVAATGFSLAGARRHGDEAGYRARLRTARLVGVWSRQGERGLFTIGGPLGDALLLAALTTEPVE